MSKQKIVKKWLKGCAGKSDARYYGIDETKVQEDGAKFWLTAHEKLLVTTLRNTAGQIDWVIL